MQKICGVDEAGRGPLAGPVIAAAVILDPNRPIQGLADSKILTEKKRLILAEIIKANALAWSVASASVNEIDEINILQATFLAMRRAIANLSILPSEILIDGNCLPPGLSVTAKAIIKGDSKVAEISAASILAKVSRDAMMLSLDHEFPQYGFKQHKGYGTKAHIAALKQWGPSREHRQSFAPVRNLVDKLVSI